MVNISLHTLLQKCAALMIPRYWSKIMITVINVADRVECVWKNLKRAESGREQERKKENVS